MESAPFNPVCLLIRYALWVGCGPGRSVKRRGKSSSLHSKIIFLLGGAVCCEWCHKWRTFWPPRPWTLRC